MADSSRQRHPAVAHPVHLRTRQHQDGMGRAARANDWAATHLAVVFGSVWTVWTFFAWPLIAQFLGDQVKGITSYYAQSWIQLFALALFVWVGNKLQRSSDAQSEVMHQALSHVAVTGDQCKELLDQGAELLVQNTALTEQVHALVAASAPRARAPRPAAKGTP